jgi:hypothetical protein
VPLDLFPHRFGIGAGEPFHQDAYAKLHGRAHSHTDDLRQISKELATPQPLISTLPCCATRAAKPKLEIVPDLPIKKPGKFSASKFKSTLADSVDDVKALVLGLRHHKISEAGDYVRLHSNEEEYWSDELCFVQVPIRARRTRPSCT